MTADHYADAADRWATAAELVYRPIAAGLVAMCPHPLAAATCRIFVNNVAMRGEYGSSCSTPVVCR